MAAYVTDADSDFAALNKALMVIGIGSIYAGLAG